MEDGEELIRKKEMMKAENIFDDFLQEERLLEKVHAVAIKRVIACKIDQTEDERPQTNQVGMGNKCAPTAPH